MEIALIDGEVSTECMIESDDEEMEEKKVSKKGKKVEAPKDLDTDE